MNKRMLFFGLSGVFFVVAAIFGTQSWKIYHEFESAIAAVPMELEFDLATNSMVRTAYHQTYLSPHGQSVCLDVDGLTSDDEIREQFAGLEGSLTIERADGSEVQTQFFNSKDIYYGSGGALLLKLPPFKRGDYSAKISIEKTPVRSDIGRIRMYSKYDVCGIELLPSYFYAAVAGILAMVGLLLAIFAP